MARSTSVPIADLPAAPASRSPSQCPGTARSAASAGRSLMFTIAGIFPRRSPCLRRGLRSARPVRRLAASSRRSAPRPCTYSDWQIVSCDTCIPRSPGKSCFSVAAICRGGHFLPSRAATSAHSRPLAAIFACFGRRRR